METTKEIGLWIRVSHEDSVKKESPEVHEKRGRMYAETKGWKVKEVYRLDAKTGKSVMEYPETRKMLTDIRSGRISGLIFSKLARLGRNTRELLEFADIFKECKADLISLHESIDTSTSAGRLFFTVVAALAQFEREETVERVSASVPIRARMGKPLGGAAPFGYMYNKDKNLILHPEESLIRKEMYSLFLVHKRMFTVATILNKRGYKTRSHKKKKGTEFTTTTIERLLRDPIAMGKRIRNYTKSKGDKKSWEIKPESEWVVNEAPAIISEEKWEMCITILNGGKKKRERRAKRAVNLFSGLIRCHCNPNQNIYVVPTVQKYVCNKCRIKIITTDIEEIFIHEVRKYINEFNTDSLVQGAAKQISEMEAMRNLIEAEIKKTNNKIDELFELFHAKQIPKEGFDKRYNPLAELLKKQEDEFVNVQADIDTSKIQMLNNEDALDDSRSIYDNWNSYEDIRKRNIVEAIVSEIILHPTEIEITLKQPDTIFKFTENDSRTRMDSYLPPT